MEPFIPLNDINLFCCCSYDELADEEKVTNSMCNDVLIEEADVEVRPEYIPMTALMRIYASVESGSILPMTLGLVSLEMH